MDAADSKALTGYESTNYKLSGISFEDAHAKIDPILVGAGFYTRKSNWKSAVYLAPEKHGGFVHLDGLTGDLTFSVVRPKR